MTPLFSESGRSRMDQLVGPGVLCVFDFDGTLSPIVERPEQATLPAAVQQRLQALSRHAPVAILTGRSLSDIGARLGFEPDFVIGNHGIEGMPGWEQRGAGFERLSGQWRVALTHALADRQRFDEGIVLEDKRYSLSIHYRLAKDPSQAERQLKELIDELAPTARVVAGKCVYNLLPPGAGDKGSALVELLRLTGAPAAVYVGDDVTDEDVFRLDRADVLGIRVEPDPDSAAEFFLPRREHVEPLLDELVRRLEPR